MVGFSKYLKICSNIGPTHWKSHRGNIQVQKYVNFERFSHPPKRMSVGSYLSRDPPNTPGLMLAKEKSKGRFFFEGKKLRYSNFSSLKKL